MIGLGQAVASDDQPTLVRTRQQMQQRNGAGTDGDAQLKRVFGIARPADLLADTFCTITAAPGRLFELIRGWCPPAGNQAVAGETQDRAAMLLDMVDELAHEGVQKQADAFGAGSAVAFGPFGGQTRKAGNVGEKQRAEKVFPSGGSRFRCCRGGPLDQGSGQVTLELIFAGATNHAKFSPRF
ncbi:hypothetical protein D9M68_140370 [compost metagenome]